MSITITATHERVDDIPAIIVHLKNMRVAELLDTHFQPNGNWQGLSLGGTTGVWLGFILSEGDHRLYRVEPWVTAHPPTLRPRSRHHRPVLRRALQDGALRDARRDRCTPSLLLVPALRKADAGGGARSRPRPRLTQRTRTKCDPLAARRRAAR